jgi:hypothetical protein
LAGTVLGVYALAVLARRGGRRATVAAGALAVLAVVELAPSPVRYVESMARVAAVNESLEREVIVPLDAATADGTRVVFLPNGVDNNDFLSVRLAAGAHLWTYNGCGDKSLVVARAQWPRLVIEVFDKKTGDETTDDLVSLLGPGLAEVVVIPYFSLRDGGEEWPPSADHAAPGRLLAAEASADHRLEVVEHNHFALVRLA